MLLTVEGELCVCELTYALKFSQPMISRHLATLRRAGIVLDRREGLWIHYRINPVLPPWARQVLAKVARANAAAEPYARDRRRLEAMPNRPPARRCA